MHSGLVSDYVVRQVRYSLQEKLNKLYKGSLSTNVGDAYQKVSKAPKNNEELTLSDEEIDMF